MKKFGAMYAKDEKAAQKSRFFTALGRYLAPMPSASGEPVSWLNYRSGIRNLYFRVGFDGNDCSVALVISGASPDRQHELYNRLLACRPMFEDVAGTDWTWQADGTDREGLHFAAVSKTLPAVSIMRKDDWADLIAFIKQHLIELDLFWTDAKPIFQAYE